MNLRKFVQLILIIPFLTTILTIYPSKQGFGYGNNFVFPIERRFKITDYYRSGHRGYDYWANIGTKITAIKNGTVVYSVFTFNDGDPYDCDGSMNAYGNLLIIDHCGTITSRYAHLSRNGNMPPIGTNFNQGAYIAIADDTGCSSGNHLHFETRTGGTWGTPFDPYASPDWVSGVPIPAGYRNKNGTTQGPFILNNSKIRDRWILSRFLDLNEMSRNICSPSRTV
jgi:murein DD-endopeptidase MepM/ murein hydrolase activator NlpD